MVMLLLGIPHADIAGESDVDIHDSVRGKNVYIVQRQRHQQPPDGIASLRPGAVSTVRVVALAHEIFPGSNFIRIYEISARAGFDFIISQG